MYVTWHPFAAADIAALFWLHSGGRPAPSLDWPNRDGEETAEHTPLVWIHTWKRQRLRMSNKPKETEWIWIVILAELDVRWYSLIQDMRTSVTQPTLPLFFILQLCRISPSLLLKLDWTRHAAATLFLNYWRRGRPDISVVWSNPMSCLTCQDNESRWCVNHPSVCKCTRQMLPGDEGSECGGF